MSDFARSEFFKSKVLGHPAGLFVLFFTEMWERFSFYGMRVLLINFLTIALVGYNPGWEWSAENAGALFGTYAGLLYLTPILGGYIADKWTGYRWAVVIGSILMTLGHASMALETELSLYMGLGLLIIGTGFFKPTMTSIVSEMYKDLPEKKDGAYTIFYMGVNAGAFFGMMLCGYLAEKVGWSYGFGLAGVFMLLGTLQFWLASPLFGDIGAVPSKKHEVELPQNINEKSVNVNPEGEDKRNPFTLVDKILVAITAIIGISYLINDPLSKIGDINLFPFKVGPLSGQIFMILIGLGLFLYLAGSRIVRYDRIVRDRMIAFIIFAFFTVFFWMSFEQGATSLVIFARDNVQRVLSGSAATMYNIINILITVLPLALITYVLYLLWRQTFKKIPGSNIVLVVCFLGVWSIVGWMLNRDWNTTAYDVSVNAIETPKMVEKTFYTKPIYEFYYGIQDIKGIDADTLETLQVINDKGERQFNYKYITESMKPDSTDKVVSRTIPIGDPVKLQEGDNVFIIHKDNKYEDYGYLDDKRLAKARELGKELDRDNMIIPAKVSEVKANKVEITVSWFSILNSFFIILFASLFSKWWDSRYNPSAATKYALGLIIMGIGFGLLAFGAYGIQEGVKVSMVWLILAYLFHTLGELCLSPVGLSYVSSSRKNDCIHVWSLVFSHCYWK